MSRWLYEMHYALRKDSRACLVIDGDVGRRCLNAGISAQMSRNPARNCRCDIQLKAPDRSITFLASERHHLVIPCRSRRERSEFTATPVRHSRAKKRRCVNKASGEGNNFPRGSCAPADRVFPSIHGQGPRQGSPRQFAIHLRKARRHVEEIRQAAPHHLPRLY